MGAGAAALGVEALALVVKAAALPRRRLVVVGGLRDRIETAYSAAESANSGGLWCES